MPVPGTLNRITATEEWFNLVTTKVYYVRLNLAKGRFLAQNLTADSVQQRVYGGVHASRRGKQMLNPSSTVVWGDKKCLLCEPRSEVRSGGSWRSRAKIIDGMKIKKVNNPMA